MDDDRRATIEAAMDSVEKAEPEVKVIEPVVQPEASTEPVQEELDLGTPKPETPEPEVKPEVKVETAPQSWKATAKTKWDTLDPEIRQEVIRREKQTTQVLNETAQARQLAQQFNQAVQPYMARLASVNAHPIAAFQELLKSDHILSTAPKAQRAQLMAKLIQDYDIDLPLLDTVLSGKPIADPVDSRVEQLLQQRLAPFQQLLAQQQQREQQENAQLAHTVETMATDPKYPYFARVRGDMADIIELMTKRNVPITIEQAYNKAIQLDPEISAEVAARSVTSKANETAARANAIAQRAKKASVSVGGAPSGGLLGSPTGNSRRDTIMAAFDAIGGR